MITIESWTAEQLGKAMPEFIELLQDSVDGGASVGFLPPLTDA
ncbi:MAG: GNAT family N-acetyltransferase, partial [Anaerolineae bacterium]